MYAYLMYREDRKTFKCHPSYGTIGKALQMSKNTVAKYVRMLEEKKLIRTRCTTFDHNGKCVNGNLEYTLLPLDEALKLHDDLQLQKLQMEYAKAKVTEKIKKYDEKHGYIAVLTRTDSEAG